MSTVNPVDGTQPLPLSELLAQILRDHPGERITLREMCELLRDRAWGGLLLTFALINVLPLPPGTTTITGIPLLILTAQLAAGRSRPWFPRRINERGLTKPELSRLIAKLLPWERRVEYVFKPRLCGLTNHRAARIIGAISFLLSVILWLPIPLGNHAPALTMTLFAMALIYRDGVLVAVGALGTIISLAMVSLTVGAAWLAITLLLDRFLPAL